MTIKAALIGALLTVFLYSAAQAEGIEVHHPYAISTGVGGRTGAAFMAIHNHGGADDALVEVRSNAARLVQLHQHVATGDGIMAMVHVTDPVVIPAEGELLLDRGGYHIMFMGLAAPFDDGVLIPVTLVFEQAGEVVIEVPVDQARFGDTIEIGDMEMGTMDMATE